MQVNLIEKEDQYYLNYCAKYLARGAGKSTKAANLTTVSEAWRFPLVDTGSATGTNNVSFVYDVGLGKDAQEVFVLGTFANLYEPIPMRRLMFLNEPTAYRALTVQVACGEVHRYQFMVGGEYLLDPINPQRTTRDDGSTWSRFFTEYTHRPVVLQRWQLQLLSRLTEQLLPFRSGAGQNFLNRHYNAGGANNPANLYRLDDSVGEVSYIDKILAREERHHLADYQLALQQIDKVLRQRNLFMPPEDMPAEMFTALYDEMATDSVSGWDTTAYASPKYFLTLLRRHSVTGAFCHPQHGGNIGAAAWAYLEENFRDSSGASAFDWRRSMAPPLGRDPNYRG